MIETETNGTTTTAVSQIAPELQIVDGHVTTTSTQVSQHFGKAHAKVMRDIRNLLDGMPEKHKANFGLMQVDVEIGNGATRKDPAYRMTRDGFTLLAMGFTGKEALQWKLAYIDTFNRMEEALTTSAPDRISPAQAQHLRELVQMIAESGKQGHGETWNRLHRKMKVNSYLNLSPTQFDDAVAYLQGKMDGQSMAALVQKHFPDATKMVAAPAQAELNLQPVIDMERIRQTMAAANEVAAKVQSVVFFELLNGKKNWQNERWCLSFSADGRNDTAPPTPRAWQIESDAVIAPLLKLASDLGKEGGMLLATTSELLALASASTKSLSRRLAA